TGYNALSEHNGLEFTVKKSTTAQREQDSCLGRTLSGGWWFKKCNKANLNGRKLFFNLPTKPLGITWIIEGDKNSYSYTYDKVEMKIRDADFGFCTGRQKS
ncbi:unnamed protein product, partial [Ixodes pacificus]